MRALIIQHLGDNWAVGIEADDPKEIETQDFSWYNHGAYNGTLKFMSERFAYIWTSEEKYKDYLYKSSMAILLNKYGNKLKSKIRRAARLLAHLRLAAHKNETFIVKPNVPTYRYVKGNNSDSKASGARISDARVPCFDEEDWKGQSLEERNARRGSGVKKQAFYKNCHVIDQPYSGCGVRSSQERYIKLKGGEKYSKKYRSMVCKNAEPDVKKGEHICYLGGKFHLPARKHKYITFLCVIQPLDIIKRNCEARTEGGKFPNRRWANVDRVLEYRDNLEEYASKYKIPKFTSFKEALDSIL